ncbi:MAG: hypothetical protein ROO71_02040 [Balneola sp.]
MNYFENFSFRKFTAILIGFAFLIVSCGDFGSKKVDNSDQEVIVNNDEDDLNERMTKANDPVEIQPMQSNKVTSSRSDFKFSLYTIAEVFPPIVQGESVQATMANIDLRNARISTSYNKQGVTYLGAIDLMEIVKQSEGNFSFRLRSGAEFTSSDVNAVYAENDKIWTALATSDPDLSSGSDRAALRMFELQNDQLQIGEGNKTSLSGFAALSVQNFDNKILATSGDNAGLTVLNENLSEEKNFIPVEDARWVDKNDQFIAVLSGDKDNDGFGEVVVLNPNTMEEQSRFPFSGASIDGGKSTIQVLGSLAIISAGNEGVKLMDLNNGTIVDELQIPANNNGKTFPTNAVAADHDLMFISNGGGGVYVAEANTNFVDYTAGTDLDLQLVGKLDFGEIASTNHIDFVGNLLVVATGEGGTKVVILKENDKDDDEDDEDDD